MRNQYVYNKNNKFYNGAKKIFEDENSIAYKPNENEKIADMDFQSIELIYKEIRKPDINYIANKVINKCNELGGIFNLLDDGLSIYLYAKTKTKEEQLLFTDFVLNYIKQDIKRNMKSLKTQIKNIKTKNKNSIKVKFNVVNILHRFQEDLFFDRIQY